MTKKEYCINNKPVAYYSGLGGLEINYIEYGINDYLYLQDKTNHLYRYIKENINKLSEMDILIHLLNETKEYGLSDVIILGMIEECK